MRNLLLLLGLATTTLSTAVSAQDWPHWRGPLFNGSAEVTGLPKTFSQTENVRWKVELPGTGASTPIVVGDRIFLSSISGEKLVALCYDRDSGELRWSKEAGSGYRPGGDGSTIGIHPRSNYASPSAVSDGERVVFFFGNGDLIAYDLEGEELWRRNLQKDHGDFCFQWTFSSSPTLWDGKLHMQILQRDTPVHNRGKKGAESFLLALDVESGKQVFRHVRPSDAIVESLESYATPIPHVYEDGRKELLIVGGDVITGHDPETGKENWRWGTWNPSNREKWWRLVPSPVVGGGKVLACGPKKAPVCAVKLGGEGDLGDAGLAWQSEGRRGPITTDVPTPLFYDGAFFVLSDLNTGISRVNAESGEIEWTKELPRDAGLWRASPTGADGRIWILSHGGLCQVYDAKSGDLTHETRMAPEDSDFIRASIVVADGSLLVRTNTTLFRIQEAPDGE